MQSEKRRIPRSTLVRLSEQLPLVGSDCASRDFDAELFKLIDSRNIRKITVMSAETIRAGLMADGLHSAIQGLKPVALEDWFSETPELTLDCLETGGQIRCETGSCGYVDAEGSFVEQPFLERIPAFTRVTESALKFKSRALEGLLRASIVEKDGNWEPDYLVQLEDKNGHVIRTYRSVELPVSIVGAVLGVMLSGWSNDHLSYSFVEEGS